jgi:hypothetical protein
MEVLNEVTKIITLCHNCYVKIRFDISEVKEGSCMIQTFVINEIHLPNKIKKGRWTQFTFKFVICPKCGKKIIINLNLN